MTDVAEETNQGSLSAAGRFARMEAALERIESKLDSKAPIEQVQRIEARLDSLELTGSREARDALRLANDVGQRISKIEVTQTIAKAERDALQEVNDNRYRTLQIAVIVVTMAGVIFNALIAAHGLFGI